MKYYCYTCKGYEERCELYKETKPETCEVYKNIIEKYGSIEKYQKHIGELERIVQGDWDYGT